MTLPGWLPWALASAGFAALTAIFGKVGVAGVPADLATMIRTAVILAITAGFVSAQGLWAQTAQIGVRSWVFLGLSGAATGLSWLAYYRALQLGDAARVAPVDKLSVLIVAVFAVLFLGERLSGLNWLGVAFVAAGVVLVALK